MDGRRLRPITARYRRTTTPRSAGTTRSSSMPRPTAVTGSTAIGGPPAAVLRRPTSLASVPYKWVNGTGPYGVFQPSNMIRKVPDDGYLYAMIRAKEPGKTDVSCLMRTQATSAALGDPTSWRAWGDGPDADSTDSFEVQFINPYTFTASDPSKDMCKAIAPGTINAASESLTYNTYFGKYLLIGVRGGSNPGFYYSLSDDLINWSPTQTLLSRETQFSYQCGDPDPVIAPSLLDPNSTSRNFETTGRDGYVYYAIFHPSNCGFGPNRDLQRVPIRFSKVPTASFTVSPSPAPINQAVTFNGSASTDTDGTIAKYEWDFDGNGTYDANTTTATTTHTYTAARDDDGEAPRDGQRRRLERNDEEPDGHEPFQSTADRVVHRFAQPRAHQPDGLFRRLCVQRPRRGDHQLQVGPRRQRLVRDRHWNDGDDGALLCTFGHAHSEAPGYRLRRGRRMTRPGSLTINNRPPTASFTASPNPAQTGQTITFNGSGSSDTDGTIVKYEWDLDGNGSYDANPTMSTASYSYATPGTVTVKLRVTDDKGATNEATHTVTVQNRPPTASFLASPNPASTGQNVIFNGSASIDLDGTITNYKWDLDGNGSFETDTGTVSTASQSYDVPGSVTVKLKVTDSSGATNETSRVLTVNASSGGPVASLSITPNPAQAGETVVLDGSSSSSTGPAITKYEWDLDGDTTFEMNTGSTPTASSSYGAAGTLTLQLRVTDSTGASNKTYGILTVEGSLPDPLPTPVPAPVPAPAPVQVQTPTTSTQTTTQSSCAKLRKQRIARLTRQLKNARRHLARAHARAAKRVYRAKVKSLSKRLKRLRATSCPN